jgi:very-short-patch-repair endonuclease
LLQLARCLKQTPPSPLRGTSPAGRGKKITTMRDDRKLSSQRAKPMRQTMTNAEVILWSRLRRGQVHGLNFRRQHPIGPFIADFACWQARLVIEVDGPCHVSHENQAKDAMRTAFLNQQGWDVIRVWNNDIYANLHGVMQAIEIRVWENLQSIQAGDWPFPPPSYGRGALNLFSGGAERVFLPESAQVEANTPSGATRHLPRKTGEENDLATRHLPRGAGEEKG